jgi:hypothetical protein
MFLEIISSTTQIVAMLTVLVYGTIIPGLVLIRLPYSPDNWEPPAGVVIEQEDDYDHDKPKPKKSSAKPVVKGAPVVKSTTKSTPKRK